MARSLDPPADAEAPVREAQAPPPGQPLPVHNPACRGCADVPGSLRVESWAGEGVAVRSRVDVRPEHQGAPGLAHGGFVTAVFDECLGRAFQMVLQRAVTARLEVDFLHPVPVGTELWVHSGADAVAGRKIWIRGSAHLGAPDGPRVAVGRGLFVAVGLDHFLTHGRAEDLEAIGATADQIAAAREG